VSRRYSCYSFTNSALDGGEWSASLPGRTLPPAKGPPVPTGQEAGWAPEPVWTQRLEEKSFASAGDQAVGTICLNFGCRPSWKQNRPMEDKPLILKFISGR
jgi:hypothetical protein